MINLAGRDDCDEHVARELRHACIPSERCKLSGHEVNTSIVGKLPGFTFKRAWTYYVVEGRVPVEIAQALYEDPLGRDDVRVAGHCGCPPPADPWLTYLDADGRELLTLGDPKHDLMVGDSEIASRVNAEMRARYRWVEDRAVAAGRRVFVDLYHVDSVAGLRLFADSVRDASKQDAAAQKAAVPIVEGVIRTMLGDTRAVNHVARERYKMAKEVRAALPAVVAALDVLDASESARVVRDLATGLEVAKDAYAKSARESVQRIEKACDRLTLFGLESMKDAGVDMDERRSHQ